MKIYKENSLYIIYFRPQETSKKTLSYSEVSLSEEILECFTKCVLIFDGISSKTYDTINRMPSP